MVNTQNIIFHLGNKVHIFYHSSFSILLEIFYLFFPSPPLSRHHQMRLFQQSPPIQQTNFCVPIYDYLHCCRDIILSHFPNSVHCVSLLLCPAISNIVHVFPLIIVIYVIFIAMTTSAYASSSTALTR
jgi:hypothetical protein